ncbi:MAG TPA: radical SAM protein [Thermoanaerobaculia bacterium]|nr:radical SAM protein [Thermoanaerobaculia bacterium]
MIGTAPLRTRAGSPGAPEALAPAGSPEALALVETPPAGVATAAGEAPLLPQTDPITQMPIVILFPHSRCNCRCVMCDIWRDKRKQEIAVDDVARWLAEWRGLGVRKVLLSGGEALLHSRLWEMCAQLRAAGIGITVLSTGLLLKRDALELARYCEEVIVSLDGPEAVHDRIRDIPRAYAKLAEGVAALRCAAPALPVAGRCTVQRLNFRHLRATVAAARELGLERISFLAADVSTDAFNRPGSWGPERVEQVALAEEELPLLAAELAALAREHARDFADGFILESPEKLRRRLLQYYAALHGQGDFHPNVCNAPWVSTVIEADGTVRPCFFQPALGNLHREGSLGAILNSPAALAWRRGLDVQRDAICRKCVCTLAQRGAAASSVKELV